jgi:hypothetical protein
MGANYLLKILMQNKLQDAVNKLFGDRIISKDLTDAYFNDFIKSGRNKALDNLEIMKKKPYIDCSTCAYFSLGGGDGAEIIEILKKSNISYGILLDIDSKATDRAREDWKKLNLPGKDLLIITGDATQQIRKCRNVLDKYRKDKKIVGVITSLQAVLHELPSRSPQFFLHSFLSDIVYDWDPFLLIIREPCPPDGWSEVVQIKIPSLPAEELKFVAEDVKRHMNNFYDLSNKTIGISDKIEGTVHVVGDFVSMSSILAIETLFKIFYLHDYNYEIEERLTALNPIGLIQVLEQFNGITCDRESFCTESFGRIYRKLKIEARNSDNPIGRLPMPNPFVRIVAERLTSFDDNIEDKYGIPTLPSFYIRRS